MHSQFNVFISKNKQDGYFVSWYRSSSVRISYKKPRKWFFYVYAFWISEFNWSAGFVIFNSVDCFLFLLVLLRSLTYKKCYQKRILKNKSTGSRILSLTIYLLKTNKQNLTFVSLKEATFRIFSNRINFSVFLRGGKYSNAPPQKLAKTETSWTMPIIIFILSNFEEILTGWYTQTKNNNWWLVYLL